MREQEFTRDEDRNEKKQPHFGGAVSCVYIDLYCTGEFIHCKSGIHPAEYFGFCADRCAWVQTGNTASVSGIMDFSTYLGAGISSAVYGVVIQYFGYLPMFVSWVILSGISAFILRKNARE